MTIISHDDPCVLKKVFNSYQIKWIKKPQNVKDAFLKELSDFECLKINLKKEEYGDKYERLLNKIEKENFFSKSKMRRKDKVTNILLVTMQTNQKTKKHIQTAKLKIIHKHPQQASITVP